MNTKRLLAIAAACAAGLTLTAAPALADRHRHDSRDTLRDTVRITNNVDSGAHGYWATLNISRTVKITPVKDKRQKQYRWDRKRTHKYAKNQPTKYKVTLTDSGTFRTIKGAKSPGAGKDILRPTTGRVSGEMTFTVESKRKPSDRKVRSVYNYRCNTKILTGARQANCPGMPTGTSTWPALYFGTDAKITETGWKWTYTGQCRDKWVNSKSGNKGDITGCPVPITPKRVFVKQPTCTTKGRITAPLVHGLTYRANLTDLTAGKPVEFEPGRYMVRATAEPGYKIMGNNTWFVDLKAPRHCPKPSEPVTPQPTTKPTNRQTVQPTATPKPVPSWTRRPINH